MLECDNLYHCYACHYTFFNLLGTDVCPDCGMYDVQVATPEQIVEYLEIQKELAMDEENPRS